MMEDKLTHDERLRLEALRQAVQLANTRTTAALQEVLRNASRFELFIKEGQVIGPNG
jgi:hypothetical protein